MTDRRILVRCAHICVTHGSQGLRILLCVHFWRATDLGKTGGEEQLTLGIYCSAKGKHIEWIDIHKILNDDLEKLRISHDLLNEEKRLDYLDNFFEVHM